MLSSGKPDIRTGRGDWGQLDVELKHCTTTAARGRATGLTRLQEISIDEMNSAGMPAICLVWCEDNKMWFITQSMEEDRRELQDWQWLPAVVKRSPEPLVVYAAAKRFLNDRDYPSADFLRVD